MSSCAASGAAYWPFTTVWPGMRLVLQPVVSARQLPWCAATLLQESGLATAVPKRRDEFIAGRRCAHEALAALGAAPAAPLARARDGAPVWPGGVRGAISHGVGWAAALVARDAQCLGVGVDVEACFAADAWADLAPLFLCPRERRLLRPGQEALIATLCFSFKECLIKAVLPQLSAPLDFLSFEVLALDFQHRSAELQLPAAAQAVFGTGLRLQAQWSVPAPALVLAAVRLEASARPR